VIRVELITVPGSGTRSIEKYLTQVWKFELFNFPHNNEELAQKPMVFNSTHFEPDGISLDRLLEIEDDVLILSTWRDPLRTLIHNLYKGRGHIMSCFSMLYELREKKPVLMVDLRCIPFQEGASDVFQPVDRVKDDNGALREAYFNKDIIYINKVMESYLERLRRFDWGDLWTEDWWR